MSWLSAILFYSLIFCFANPPYNCLLILSNYCILLSIICIYCSIFLPFTAISVFSWLFLVLFYTKFSFTDFFNLQELLLDIWLVFLLVRLLLLIIFSANGGFYEFLTSKVLIFLVFVWFIVLINLVRVQISFYFYFDFYLLKYWFWGLMFSRSMLIF